MILYELRGFMMENDCINRNDLMNIIIEILEENSVSFSDESSQIEMDSLQYISVLVAIEEKLNIELPVAVLSTNIFSNLDNAISIIGFVLGERYLE